MTGKIDLRHPGWIVFLAGVFSVITGLLLLNHDVVAGFADPVEYMEGAENLKGYDSAYHPPFYPVVVAGLKAIVGDVFLAGKLVSFLAGIAMVVLTWLLGRLCFRSSRVAVLATCLVVFSPLLIRYGYVVASDMLGAALFLASLYALAAASRGSLKALCLAAFLAGLAYMTRTVYLAIMPAAVLYILVVMPAAGKKKLSWTLLYLAIFALVASPWSIICFVRHGNLHNLSYANIAFGALDDTGSWLRFDAYVEKYPSALSIFTQHPEVIVKHFARNVALFPYEVVVKEGYFAGIMALLGFFAMLRKPTLERLTLVFSGLAVLTLTLLAWLKPRFFVPVIPLLMLFSAHFMIRCVGRSALSFWPRDASIKRVLANIPLRGVLVGLAVLTAIAVSAVRVPDDFAQATVHDEKPAGQFLAENTPENTVILSTSRNLGWYAHRPFLSMNELGDISPEDLEQAVRRCGAGVIVYTRRHSVWTHPQLEYLLDPDDSRIPPSFRVIYQSGGDWPVVAYRVE